MSTTLPQDARDLLDAPEFATVATIEADGRPQLSVVWIGRDGDDVLFSTLAGRRKSENLRRDPRITLLVYPAQNPYHYLEIRGSASITEDPTGSYIDVMSQKYMGKPWPNKQPGEQRVIVRVTPEHLVQH